MTNAVNIAQGGSNNVTFRNRIINGAMVIDQRNSGSSVATTTTGSYVYTLDRWRYYATVASKYTVQQNAGSVTLPTGFTNYIGATSSSAYAVSSSDTFFLSQVIEGYNIADLGWGTASAKTVTLSFQVYSSLTGNFGGSLRNIDTPNRSYPFSYTVSSANTWTTISVTIPGDTSGTWNTTNGQGIQVQFNLGSGSTFSGTANSWQTGNLIAPTGSVSVVGTNGATLYITGVQLEAGTTASPFEYRQYGTELGLCQRYYFLSNPSNQAKTGGAWGSMYSGSTAHLNGPLPVAMRIAPTVTYGGTSNTYYISNINGASSGSPINSASSPLIIDFEVVSLSGGAVGYPVMYNGQLSATAEL